MPRYQKLPIIPSDEQWRVLREATHAEPMRNRLMFALAYSSTISTRAAERQCRSGFHTFCVRSLILP